MRILDLGRGAGRDVFALSALARDHAERHFAFIGNLDTHGGLLAGCGGKSPFRDETPAGAACCGDLRR